MPQPTQRSVYDSVSPLEFRYYGVEPALVDLLSPYVTERARLAYELKVEVAAARVLARRGICPPEAAREIEVAAARVTAEEVAAEEARIHHNIRAMVNCLQARVSDPARPFVHFTLTSFDVIDTAIAARLKDCTQHAVAPKLLELEATLITLARRERDRPQIGRTHGQHAVPITFGFALAEYVSRLGERIEAIQAAAAGLRGKVSGAVGAYNASSLLIDDPAAFEAEVLAEVGLKPAWHSTQIVAPEHLTDFMHALTSCFAVLAALADDMRHLQRTEISEVGEAFEANQVGSSTMPHKRNPWNFENVKSLYKAFMPRMVSVYLDQLSEHQRDLTNSATNRFLPETIVGLMNASERLRRIMSRLVVDGEHMRANLELTAGMCLAEPLYILLAGLGHPDAHEAVRRLTLEAERSGRRLWDVAEESDIRPYLERMTGAQRAVLQDPVLYQGIAARRVDAICDHYAERLGLASR